MMRHAAFLLALLVAAPLPAQAPPLQALAGHAAGSWTMTPIGGRTAPQSLCLVDAGPMLTGGRPAGQCSFTVVEDGESEGAVNFRCKGSLSGRTSVRRDAAGIYTVHTQGVANGHPFVSRSEWRHGGRC